MKILRVLIIHSFILLLTTFASGHITFYGIVRSSGKVPIANAKIILFSNNEVSYQTNTNSEGYYSISINVETNIHDEASNIPEGFSLFQNYPNLFNPSTIISFDLPSPDYIKINIYNILGQKMLTLANEYFTSGLTTLSWNGNDQYGRAVSAGIYFYQLQTQKFNLTKKMVLLDGGLSGQSSSYPTKQNYYKYSNQLSTQKLFENNSTMYVLNKFIVEKDGYHGYYERDFVINPTQDSVRKDIELVDMDSLKLFIIEKDHLFGGFEDVDNYHHTLIINTNQDSLLFDVESPTPDSLIRESIRSPAYGWYAFIYAPYSNYFNMPIMNNEFVTDKPDTSTKESHFWNNLKLGPSDAMHIPYSNYLGEGEELFIKEFGTNSFLDLDVISNYNIKKDTVDTLNLNIEMKLTMKNTGSDTLFQAGVLLFIPRKLNIKSEDIHLYNLISDTVISNIQYNLYHGQGTVDGFANWATGQEISILKDTLLPHQSFEFTYKMTIETFLNKFEIYPKYNIHLETKGESVWPKSILTINNIKYNGHVNYLKIVGLALPTYILFSINNGEYGIVNPEDIEPTFKPDS